MRPNFRHSWDNNLIHLKQVCSLSVAKFLITCTEILVILIPLIAKYEWTTIESPVI